MSLTPIRPNPFLTDRRRLLLGAASAAALLPVSGRAQAAWPNRSVRVIVPFPPGGLTDAYARMYCEHLSRKFGQAFNIENKTGAGGTLGAGEVAKAAPDGYTLLISTSTATWQAKVLYKKLPYTPVKDFDPVALFPSGALLVAVNANVPAKNLRELVTFAKANPAAWGTYGAGSWAHMLGDVLNKSEKLKMVVAHYRGEAPMLTDLIGGQIQAGVGSVQGIMPHIQTGKLRAIGATGKVRTPRLPDLSTLVEQGWKDFEYSSWQGLVAPAKTPPAIINLLSAEMAKAVKSPEVVKRLASETQLIGSTPEEFARHVVTETERWRKMTRESGITLDD